MRPVIALSTAAPPASSTIVVGRVLTTPAIHPRTPMRNPVPTMTQRRRCARATASRSRSRCSTPDASSFQPRTRAASDFLKEGTPGGAVTCWATPRTSYTVCPARQAAGPSPEAQVPGGEEGVDLVTRQLQSGTATFVAVHHGQDAKHPAPLALDDADGLLGGAAGGDHVFHDDHARAGREAALDAVSGAVVLPFLADGEGVEDGSPPARGGGDAVGDGVGTERQPPDQLGLPAAGRETLETQGADHGETLARHGGLPSVDVEGGSPSRGEDKVASP